MARSEQMGEIRERSINRRDEVFEALYRVRNRAESRTGGKEGSNTTAI
jgi:hypothetical protein